MLVKRNDQNRKKKKNPKKEYKNSNRREYLLIYVLKSLSYQFLTQFCKFISFTNVNKLSLICNYQINIKEKLVKSFEYKCSHLQI